MKVAITSVIWPERCESSYMITHFCEHFFKIFDVFQVYIFFSKLGHIQWHIVKDFQIFDFFWISDADFKIRSKRWTWPFIPRCRILQESWYISDEIGTFVSKNDFFKKSWANYEAHVVQFWPAYNWIDRKLSFSREVDGNLYTPNHLVICTYHVV